MIDNRPLPGRLFGTHVADRADQVARLGQAGRVMEVGQAEVGDPDVAAEVDQEVRRLDVAMHDALLMRIFEGFRRLRHAPGDRPIPLRRLAAIVGEKRAEKCPCVGSVGSDLDGRGGKSRIDRGGRLPIACLVDGTGGRRFAIAGRRGTLRQAGFERVHPRFLTQLADHHVQGLTFHELHGVEMDAALASHAIHGNDVRMMKVGRSLRLLLESLQLPGVERWLPAAAPSMPRNVPVTTGWPRTRSPCRHRPISRTIWKSPSASFLVFWAASGSVVLLGTRAEPSNRGLASSEARWTSSRPSRNGPSASARSG